MLARQTECMRSLDCHTSDDTCSARAILSAYPDVSVVPAFQACLTRQKDCKAAGAGGFSDDSCGLRLYFVESAQVAFDQSAWPRTAARFALGAGCPNTASLDLLLSYFRRSADSLSLGDAMRARVLIATALFLAIPGLATAAPNADNPPYGTERNGVYDIPWGSGHFTWPEKLFWEAMPNPDWGAMQGVSDGIVADGKVPVFSMVAWGSELADGLGARSNDPGFKQYGEWFGPRSRYFAQQADGAPYWDGSGYITPMMPLDAADCPAGMKSCAYGDWLVERLGTLAVKAHVHGGFAADFVEALGDHSFSGAIDWNPRSVHAFEAWAGIVIPGSSPKEWHDWVKANAWPKWNDWVAEAYAKFYAGLADKIRTGLGVEPLMGAQTHLDTSWRRWCGTDYRLYLKHMPAKNWYFQIELQSDSMRSVPPMWLTSTKMGLFAAREPDMPLGSHMDADHEEFWNSVRNQNHQTDAWGWSYLKHHWLSVGWQHVAMRDGSVQRGTRAFYRHYWDGGKVDPTTAEVMRAHIPRHPFGLAGYYSEAIERDIEQGTEHWDVTDRMAEAVGGGLPIGYFVSDAALDALRSENYPSAWVVYEAARLPAAERTKLEAIAPIVDAAGASAKSPLSFSGKLTGFAFMDQKSDLVLLVGNTAEQEIEETVSFVGVKDGSFSAIEQFDKSSTALSVSAGKGSFKVHVAARETRAFVISGLDLANRVVGPPPPTCTGAQLLCGRECVDVATSVNHCGGCTTLCKQGQTCAAGLCAGAPTGPGWAGTGGGSSTGSVPGSGAASGAGAPGAGASGGAAAADSSDSSGGCGCRVGQSSLSNRSLLFAAALTLLGLRRRRKAR